MKQFKISNDEQRHKLLGRRGAAPRFNYDDAAEQILAGQVVEVEARDQEDAIRLRATGKNSLSHRISGGVATRVVQSKNGQWAVLFGKKGGR